MPRRRGDRQSPASRQVAGAQDISPRRSRCIVYSIGVLSRTFRSRPSTDATSYRTLEAENRQLGESAEVKIPALRQAARPELVAA